MGVPQDIEKAKHWFTQAAKGKDKYSMVELGTIVTHFPLEPFSFSVTFETIVKFQYCDKDGNKALNWFNKAAEMNYGPAYRFMASLYIQGTLVPVNMALAVEYLEKGIALGDYESNTLLATLYFNGEGVQRSEEKARELYMEAANRGSVVALLELGEMFEQGRACQRDPMRALTCYMDAADKNSVEAMEILVAITKEGFDGFPPDENTSHTWLGAWVALEEANADPFGNFREPIGFQVEMDIEEGDEEEDEGPIEGAFLDERIDRF